MRPVVDRGCGELVLRPARPEDLPAVLELLRAAKLPTEGVPEAFAGFTVAESEGRLAGVSGLEVYDREGLLRSLAVAPEWRGCGLGGALTEAIVARAAAEGLAAVYLLTDTAADFFPRHGFRAIPRAEAGAGVRTSIEFTVLCPASSTLMVREVSCGTP